MKKLNLHWVKGLQPFDVWDLEFMAVRFNPLPLQDDFLNERYEWQKNENGVEWPYYRFFYHLADMLKPNLVVELGGYQGTAAAHFAAGCPDATVITIDHHTDPGDDINEAKMEEVALEYSNIKYIRRWTNPEVAAREKGKHALGNVGDALPLITQKAQLQTIDILFIDSWHTYENAMLDWKYYEPFLSNPALVICDDIEENNSSTISRMMRFWREMPEPKFLNGNLHPGTYMGFIKYDAQR